ncbi:MAG: hypothetical protein Q9196_001517 [Gyalolechia fulgens]
MSTSTVTQPVKPSATFDSLTPISTHKAHDFETELGYVRVSDDGIALGPSTWGKTDHEEDRDQLVPVTIHDVRPRQEAFSLDKNGFQIVKHRTVMNKDDYLDDENIKKTYYPDLEQMIKAALGASVVKVYHHLLRHSSSPNPEGSVTLTRPFYKVHVDSTPNGVIQTIKHFLGPQADTLLQKRYAMINAWRPLKPVYKDPLTYLDASTVSDEAFIPRELNMPDGRPSLKSTAVNVGEGHMWYYLYGQNVDEVALVRCWDSKDGVAKRCPHSAARDPATEDLEDRESIEARCLVFWEE